MQKIVVDVEDNLLNKRSRLREEEKNRTKKEQMTSSEVTIDVLENTLKEMVQTISRKDEPVVQKSHVSLVPENKNLIDLKQFAAHPWHSKT